MWKYDSVDNRWYRLVTSGFLTLTFTLEIQDDLFLLKLLDNRSSTIKLCASSIEHAKQSANEHIKHALKWV